MDGTLGTYQGVFYVNTKGAGAGELTVNVRGPKGTCCVLFEFQFYSIN